MAFTARLAAVTLDCQEPAELAAFYRALCGLEPLFESEDFVALRGAGFLLTAMRVETHQPTDWPEADVPKQLHLELAVKDLEAAEAAALSLGARKPDAQPAPERFRVLIDPAGHPFCITTMIPEDALA